MCCQLRILRIFKYFVKYIFFPNFSEVKPSSLTIEYEKKSGKGVLMMRKMAHLVPIKDRMLLFRRQVQDDKNRVATSLNDPQMQTWITVQRNRIIEDGFNHLSKLTIPALKSTIRVKFVNEQGLDEAGIDQDGVFKEFLELTLKKVFDPQLNLFSTTSTGKFMKKTVKIRVLRHKNILKVA